MLSTLESVWFYVSRYLTYQTLTFFPYKLVIEMMLGIFLSPMGYLSIGGCKILAIRSFGSVGLLNLWSVDEFRDWSSFVKVLKYRICRQYRLLLITPLNPVWRNEACLSSKSLQFKTIFYLLFLVFNVFYN